MPITLLLVIPTMTFQDVYLDIYSYIFGQFISHIFWHSIWHIFWHSIWHSIWHSFWHSFIWHSICHSITGDPGLRSSGAGAHWAREVPGWCPAVPGAGSWDPLRSGAGEEARRRGGGEERKRGEGAERYVKNLTTLTWKVEKNWNHRWCMALGLHIFHSIEVLVTWLHPIFQYMSIYVK